MSTNLTYSSVFLFSWVFLLQDELQRLLELLKEPEPLGEDQLQKLCIEMNDFIVALSSVQPSAKREGFVTVPDVTWADIGALEDIREELTMAILVCVDFCTESYFIHAKLKYLADYGMLLNKDPEHWGPTAKKKNVPWFSLCNSQQTRYSVIALLKMEL